LIVALLLPQVLIFILFAAAVIEGALQSWAEFGLVFLGAAVLGSLWMA
jgi:hypothetical protein